MQSHFLTSSIFSFAFNRIFITYGLSFSSYHSEEDDQLCRHYSVKSYCLIFRNLGIVEWDRVAQVEHANKTPFPRAEEKQTQRDAEVMRSQYRFHSDAL